MVAAVKSSNLTYFLTEVYIELQGKLLNVSGNLRTTDALTSRKQSPIATGCDATFCVPPGKRRIVAHFLPYTLHSSFTDQPAVGLHDVRDARE
jgi:hypothetical protein